MYPELVYTILNKTKSVCYPGHQVPPMYDVRDLGIGDCYIQPILNRPATLDANGLKFDNDVKSTTSMFMSAYSIYGSSMHCFFFSSCRSILDCYLSLYYKCVYQTLINVVSLYYHQLRGFDNNCRLLLCQSITNLYVVFSKMCGINVVREHTLKSDHALW